MSVVTCLSGGEEIRMKTESQKFKLEKDKVVVEADLVKAQPSYPNVQQLIELLVNSLKPELVKILIDHDFSASILIKLKKLPSKINEINGAVGDLKKYMKKLEIEVPGDLKELLGKLEEFQSFITVAVLICCLFLSFIA
ncbi:hypothetical protein Tco_1060747 [Tanacetum coccineum]